MNWIKVTDKLPEIGQEVFLDTRHVATYRPNIPWDKRGNYQDGSWDYNICICCNLPMTDPTYWMPLPESPQIMKLCFKLNGPK